MKFLKDCALSIQKCSDLREAHGLAKSMEIYISQLQTEDATAPIIIKFQAKEGMLIPCIKELRNMSGLGLKDAKESVEKGIYTSERIENAQSFMKRLGSLIDVKSVDGPKAFKILYGANSQ